MADLSDCMDALALRCEAAVYPNGLNASGVIPAAVDIAQGWPMAGDLDTALGAGRSMVTVFAVPGTTSILPTPFNFDPQPVSTPVYGMGADGDETGFTLWGKPSVGEYATILIDQNRAYSYTAELGDLSETVMAILAQRIATDYPGTAWAGQGVVVVGAKSLDVRIGAPAMVGDVVARQRQQFRLSIWSPNPADRAALGRAIDVAVKREIHLTFPDTSTGFVTYQGSNLIDERQNVNIYRRDIVVFVQWDTVDLIPSYEVTAMTVNFKPGPGPLQRAV